MKRKPMKPMYRTAAEERLILAAIADVKASAEWENAMWSDEAANKADKATAKYKAAARAVVRERGKKR